MQAPIFIIGTERSGSNLLRLILNQHPAIAIPHPPHILKEMMPLEAMYGDLGTDKNFRRLVDDTVSLVELHFLPWDVAIDRETIFREAPGRDVYGVKAAIYDQYRKAKGKARWGCKSTFVIEYVDCVRKYHPAAKFIHLVRDGRDVAVSAKESVFNHFHPYYVAKLWSRQQRTAIDLSRKLSPSEMFTVRYEDLIESPEKTVLRICQFIGEDYSDSLLRYYEGQDAARIAEKSRSWENCAKPVLKNNHSKYRSALSPASIHAFEQVAFEELRHFGYRLEGDYEKLREQSTCGFARLTLARYWLWEQALGAYVGATSLAYDHNALRRLRKALFVRWLRIRLHLKLAINPLISYTH